MILTHDIVIILDRINTLKGTVAAGSLDTLRAKALESDAWLQENTESSPKCEAVHDWLGGVQEKLGAMVETVGDSINECPV
jgi:hypothetical protein